MSEPQVWLDDVSSSPYADQLARGFRWLRFVPELEREFTEASARESLELKRIALYVAVVVWLLFSVSDWWLLQGAVLWKTQLVRLMVLAVLLTSFSFFRRPETSWLEWGSAIPILSLGLGAAAIVAIAHTTNITYPYEGLLLICFAAYFFAGLRLFKALLVSLLMLFGYVLMERAAGLPDDRLLSNFLFLLTGNLIGAVGCYLLEYKSREHFLSRRLLRLLADHDSLTGLHNRRSYTRELERLWRLAQREKVPLSLLLCDVDHFKAYNDNYGHQAGDQVLKALGRLLNDAARRPLDVAARVGGEEFAVLLYGLDQGQALAHAEALRLALLQLGISHEYSKTAPVVSMSIGLACLSPNDDTRITRLFSIADEALYRAKDAGRNQVAL